MAEGANVSEDELEEVEDRQRPRSAVIFETIRRGLSWLPRSRRGPVLSRLIHNPRNFALKA